MDPNRYGTNSEWFHRRKGIRVLWKCLSTSAILCNVMLLLNRHKTCHSWGVFHHMHKW